MKFYTQRYGIGFCITGGAWRSARAPFLRKGGAPKATEDRGVRSWEKSGPILSPIGQLLPEEGAYVTELLFVSPVLHDVVQKPPFLGRGATLGDIGGCQVFAEFLGVPQSYRAAPF